MIAAAPSLPSGRTEGLDIGFKTPAAHRGLWSPGAVPENSLAAFRAAAEAGYGVELDVRLSADGEAMVFHDVSLRRMTGLEGRLEDFTCGELAQARLGGGEEGVPTLKAALAACWGTPFVFIELKTPIGEEGPLEEATLTAAATCDLRLAVIGFNPRSAAYMAARRPGLARGVNLSAEAGVSAQLAAAKGGDPDFLLPDLRLLSDPQVQAQRAALPLVAWTARSFEDARKAEGLCDGLIFEGFRP